MSSRIFFLLLKKYSQRPLHSTHINTMTHNKSEHIKEISNNPYKVTYVLLIL